MTDGILGGYATVGGTDWAAVSGANIVAFSGYTPLASTAGSDTANSLVTTAQTQSGAVTTNSLKIASGGGLVLGANNLLLSSGGLLHTGIRNAAITGTGTLSGSSSSSELIVHTAGGSLDIATPIIGAGSGSLTKTGSGSLYLSGTSGFTGSININGGELVIIGTGSNHPSALGSQTGIRDININGGAFRVLGDYNFNVVSGANMRLNVGPAGGTLHADFGGSVLLDDANEFTGAGDLTITGGGRVGLGNTSVSQTGFTGNIIVNGGILSIPNVAGAGGRQEQTITLKSGSALVNGVGAGLGIAGLPHNLVLEGGSELQIGGNADRAIAGNIHFSGANTIALLERDNGNNTQSQRGMYLNGRLTGSNVTLNVFGASNGSPLFLGNGSNDISGTINLNANAGLEARTPGSLGTTPGAVTVNLNGAYSRLLLRHYDNGNYMANVVANATSIIDADRLANYGGGANQLLSINNLTANLDAEKLLNVNNANGYTVRVGGTATSNGYLAANVGGTLLLENGINFASGTTLDKRGGGSLILRGASNNTGATIIQAGTLLLRGANGSLPNTSAIQLRGGELRIENGDAINTTRLNPNATLDLGGGVLRVSGEQALPSSATASVGNTTIVFNQPSDSATTALSLGSAATPFTRELGATVQFQSGDFSGAVGSATVGQSHTSPRILIPGQANVTGNAVVPGLFGNNNLDFVQYDGTTMDNGQALGIREMRNPGSVNSPANYSDNQPETNWTDNLIARSTSAGTVTLSGNRALEAYKVEAAMTIALGANNLRIENGGILAVGSASTITGTGTLTAGPATPGTNTAELFLGGNNTLTITAVVGNNGAQPVALVKTGTGTVVLDTATNTYTGGTYLNSGFLTVQNVNSLGGAANTLRLNGGTLNLNVGNASTGAVLDGLRQNVVVGSNGSIIVLDNGSLAGTNNRYAFGSLTISGPYTLGVRGFDSQDISFAGASFAGTPTLDFPQVTNGSNPNNAGAESVMTISGEISGSGFFIGSSGNANDTSTRLLIGGGTTDTVPNIYNGKVVTLPGSNNDDLIIELNKADGVTAINGDLEINGGIVRPLANNQIADTSKVLLTNGTLTFNGKNETIASVTQDGGVFKTNSGGVSPANTIRVTGDYIATGTTNFTGTNGIEVGNNSTLQIDGTLRLNGYSKANLGASAANLILGGLEMTGTILTQSNGGGENVVILNGDLTTNPSPNSANLGNSTDSDTFLELNGSRNFNVADGGAGIDLVVSTVVRNNGATAGGILKNGAGTMQLQGGGTANSYTGPTTINEGTLVLFKNAGVNSLGSGAVTIGDGIGGTRADKLVVRNSNQINDGASVTVAASGVLDLDSFNTSEQIASLSGDGTVDLGPGSTLTISGSASGTFAGSIFGGGSVTKGGTGTLRLSGANEYVGATIVNSGTLEVTGSIAASPVTVNSTATLAGTGTLANVLIANGGIVTPGLGIGTLTTGSFDLQSGATLKLELGSTIPGNYDQINVSGGLTLAGDLQGTLLNGYIPSLGPDLFFVMINDGNDAISGTFNGIPEGGTIAIGGYNFTVTYLANWTGNPATSSFTGGNDVALSVPEPSALITLMGGMGALVGLQRFRRRRA